MTRAHARTHMHTHQFINPLEPVLGDRAPLPEVKAEDDVIPHGLGYYSGALESGEYQGFCFFFFEERSIVDL